MTYDDIWKDFANWTDFLENLKKDISSGQIQNYLNVSNALKKLGNTIRSLEKMLDKKDDKTIRRRCDNLKNLIKELQDIVSDSTSKRDSYIKVTNRLDDLIGELNELSELKPAETVQNRKATISAIIISFIMILLFELLVHVGPLSWFKNHPNSYSLQGSIICLIPCVVVGFLKPQWRKWCWGSSVAFVVLILSLV